MGSKNIRWAEKLLTQVIDELWLEDILGDLEEYLYDLQELPSWKRNLYFWFHVLCCLRSSLLKPLYQPNSTIYSMLKFNTKLAIRSAIKHPGLSGASVLTLILGALCFQLIFSWLTNERSMNKMHSTYDQLYITAVKTNPNADLTSISLQTMFRLDYEQFPEIIAASQIHVYQKDEIKLSTTSHDYKGKALIVDSTFLQMLDFNIIAGNDEVLYDPSSIAITQQMAERMFSGKNAIGQTVQLSCDQQGTYQIAAIIEDIPASSSIDFDFLVPRHSQAFWRRIPQEIVLTKPDLDEVAFNERIKTLGRATNDRFPESELYFIPLRKCYEDSIISASLFNKYGNSTTIQILTFVAAMIWLITMFGFNNLQLTLQLSIAKNLGIQHIIGGSKRDINSEMILGRVLFFLTGLSASLLIYQVLFPVISRFLEIAIDQSIGVELLGMGLFLSSVILISILTGTIHLIRLNPARALHNVASLKIPLQQKALTTTQYVITTILIIGTCVVYLQFDYMLSTDLGLKHTDVYSVDFYEMSSASDEAHNVSYLRNQLNSLPSIAYYAQGDLPIGTKVNATSWKRSDSDYEYTTENMMIAAPAYFDLLGLELVEGRFFSDSLDEPSQQKVVINESALNYWNITDLDQQKLKSNTSGRSEFDFDIIGVVKDYHYQHMAFDIKPLILRYRSYDDDPFLIRFKPVQASAGLASLEELFTEINPKGTFEYESLQERLATQYDEEKKLAKIYLLFAVVALLLSSISLFTFSFYEAKRRTKEIGVRKVIGASTTEIFSLLSKSFGKTIIIAYLLATPVAYYFQSQWMTQFENQARIEWWVYAGTAAMIFCAALSVTGYHTWQVARQNPVRALRYE